MSVEQLIHTREFESIIPQETERKFLPIFPEVFETYRVTSQPIEQFYLSHPLEPFSLRFREQLVDGELTYEATLKDAGKVGALGLQRMEVTTPMTSEQYTYYKSGDTPIIRKLRAEPRPGVTLDFYEDGSLQIESENELEWRIFAAEHQHMFVETTGDHASNNEWQAHLSFRRAHNGREALTPSPDLDPSDIVRDIRANLQPDRPITIHIGGRSGSGKSTIVREVQAQLETRGISSCVLSTDDYHRGNTWLSNYNGGEPWTHWDDPVVYDTKAMAADLANLRAGNSIYAREINWSIVEPHFPGIITPTEVIIIEGIYARSPDITSPDDLNYEMTTPLAACIGRRLLRDLKERPQFANPAESLSYMLREAEPAYRAQSTEQREQIA